MLDNVARMPDTIERLPENEQEQQIYKYVLETGSITTLSYDTMKIRI